MAEERKLILKLGQKITDRIGVKVTVNDPEYWGLASVVTDEMAEVALSMKVRKPATAEQIAKKCGKSLERTEELLQEMSVIGLIEYNWENADHHKQYILPMFVPGCAEFMVMNKEQVETHTEIADFFEQMSRLPLEKVTPMVPLGGSGIGMHVIPVEKAIPAQSQSASVEHISHWLKKYEGKYAAGACSCRRQQRIRGEGTGDLEEDLCIGVGDMADYLVETGKGHYITYDEVMEILERSEKNGYVHQITNIDGEDKIFAICNCAVGVCNALPSYLIPPTCPVLRTGLMWIRKNVWHADDAWRVALREQQNWDRSFARNMVKSSIPSRNCRMKPSGDRKNGVLTIGIRTS